MFRCGLPMLPSWATGRRLQDVLVSGMYQEMEAAVGFTRGLRSDARIVGCAGEQRGAGLLIIRGIVANSTKRRNTREPAVDGFV